MVKGANVLHPNGLIYTQSNLDELLFVRYAKDRERRQKKKKHAKGTFGTFQKPHNCFSDNLTKMIGEIRGDKGYNKLTYV